MPFGLRNAAQTFQRFIDQVLHGLPLSFAYFDDILVASHDAAKHLDHLWQVFTRLQEHGLQIHPDKCVLSTTSLDFLGFHVGAGPQGFSTPTHTAQVLPATTIYWSFPSRQSYCQWKTADCFN